MWTTFACNVSRFIIVYWLFYTLQIDHWITFSIGPLSCNQDFQKAVLYLNKVLAPSTFLVGNSYTIADFAVFESLFGKHMIIWKLILKVLDKVSWFPVVTTLIGAPLSQSLQYMTAPTSSPCLAGPSVSLPTAHRCNHCNNAV